MFVLVEAPINIALAKYWGKSDDEQNFPGNTSISLTISTNYMGTRTRAHLCRDCDCNKQRLPWITLNNQVERLDRVHMMLKEIEAIRMKKKGTLEGIPEWKNDVVVESWNIGPTATGLASSSSGYAALALALCRLDQSVSYNNTDIAQIAQKGSVSAARSILGGFVMMMPKTFGITKLDVEWDTWQDLHVWIIQFGDDPKDVSSTDGMLRTVRTSELYPSRLELAETRAKGIKDAIQTCDTPSLLYDMMRDSNQFHATCMDTFPPIMYLTDASREIIGLVHRYNKESGVNKVGYTFDAGQHAVIMGFEKDLLNLESGIIELVGRLERINGPGFKVRLFKTHGSNIGTRVIESDIRPL